MLMPTSLIRTGPSAQEGGGGGGVSEGVASSTVRRLNRPTGQAPGLETDVSGIDSV